MMQNPMNHVMDVPADRAATAAVPASPLMLHTLAVSRRPRRAVRPVLRGVGERTWDAAPADEVRAAREAFADPRDTQERVLDAVVDRLLRELVG